MRILFVCFSYSVHAARWIGLLAGQGWDIHVVPSQDFDSLHEQFTGITYWPACADTFDPPRGISMAAAARDVRARTPDDMSMAHYIRGIIEHGRYDIVHSLEFQHAGYLTADALAGLVGRRPTWIATNYGSDIYHYRNQPGHRQRIAAVLRGCDVYAAECQRDVDLAREMGFTGRVFPICPNGGGIDVDAVTALRSPLPPSRRRVIAVKGYEHFAGRALTVLEALKPLAPALHGYQVVVYAPAPEVRDAADRLRNRSGIDITCTAEQEPQDVVLALHGRSRISIANSVSDGISTSLLEAMAAGSFPIQSCSACADEWVVHGSTGLLTDPDDAATIRTAVRRALEDDALVDRAALVNQQTIQDRAAIGTIRERVVQAYRDVMSERREPGVASAPRATARRPSLTVITPTFNRAAFLPETISSVLSQSLQDFEYLIIDDGSHDDSEAVVRQFDDPRIRFVKQQNVGETRTVNRALQQVAGEYFTIVNSDDPARPDAFATMLAALQAAPDALMAYPDWQVIGEESEVIAEIRLIDFTPEDLLMRGTVGIGPGAMFRQSVVELVGLRNPLIRYAADLDYIFRLSLRGRMIHVPQILATHRVHAASASLAEQSERLSLETLDLLRVYGRHPLQAKNLRQRHREAFAVGCFSAGMVAPDAALAVRLLTSGFLAHPIATLRRFQEHGVADIGRRLEAVGCRKRGSAARWFEQALAAPSRHAAAHATVRAILSDPVGTLNSAVAIGLPELDRRIRALPMAAPLAAKGAFACGGPLRP